ncbi:hypothetical protein [Psychroserpens burtonensis]|nr:hypothetical protein [Psychroserpens burtonensis]
MSLKNYPEALNYYGKAKNINIEINNQLGLISSYIGLA